MYVYKMLPPPCTMPCKSKTQALTVRTMHFFQLVAAWLFPCAVCATMEPTAPVIATDAASIEHDGSSSPAFSTGGIKITDPGSSPSASSTSSSSSLADQLGLRTSQERSPPASSPCLGTRARSPEKHGEATAARTALKDDAVGKYLRKISRRLVRGRGRAADEESKGRCLLRKSRSPLPPSRSLADDTTRDRQEVVAGAIAYCKETLRRGGGTSPPPPLPSFHGWLLERNQEVGFASAVAQCKCKESRYPPLPPPRRDGALLEKQVVGGTATADARCKESPPPAPPRRDGLLLEMQEERAASAASCCKQSPSPSPQRWHGSLLSTQKDGTACADVHCEESSHHGYVVGEMSACLVVSRLQS